MQTITLRTATVADAALLRHWDTQPHVMEARNISSDDLDDDDWDWDNEIPRRLVWRELLIAEQEHRAIGFIQIINPHLEETHYWGDCEPNLRAIDIWIGEESDLGKGYGTVMMRLALQRCFATPEVTAVLIDPLESNVRALLFYERLGFHFVEKRLFDEDACCVYRLEREDFSVPLGA
jgi:aminoglycoside 6'-N-acetyltransferase